MGKKKKKQQEKVCCRCGKFLPHGPSKSGYCADCSVEVIRESIKQMMEKKGPYYEKWKASMRRWVRELLKEEG